MYVQVHVLISCAVKCDCIIRLGFRIFRIRLCVAEQNVVCVILIVQLCVGWEIPLPLLLNTQSHSNSATQSLIPVIQHVYEYYYKAQGLACYTMGYRVMIILVLVATFNTYNIIL